ncbi:hypothetical protein LOZ58_004212 [Ophidiomyces ophidiicola]|nr:hypothetical protein LOZ58_004212 [Ophidiomyces ophidiicola]
MTYSLQTIPAELFLSVVDYIPSLRDLLNLASCSRRCYDIATPRAYRSVFFSFGSLRAISGLLRTILLNPTIAEFVFSVDVLLAQNHPGESFLDDTNMPPLFPIPHQFLERAVNVVSTSRKEKYQWLSALNSKNPDAYVALLLSPLVNLKTLILRPWGRGSYCFKILQRAAADDNDLGHTFPRLQDLRLYDNGSTRLISSNMLASLVLLPALKHLEAWSLYDDEMENIDWAGLGRSHVTHIALTGAVCVNGLGKLLPSCRNLKVFDYTHCYPGDVASFDPHRLYESLHAVKDTLEILRFRSYQRQVNNRAFIGSFAGFTALKELEIGARFLHSLDMAVRLHTLFPVSLEKLKILSLSKDRVLWALQEIDFWLNGWLDSTPDLRKVVLGGSGFFTMSQCSMISHYMQKWKKMTHCITISGEDFLCDVHTLIF